MRKVAFLFLIILIEGYVVLACELLAIRQLIPLIGSGTEIVAIIISGVLLPLAIGYHAGGNAFKRVYARTKSRAGKHRSIRKLLLRNILVALAFLTLGLSSPALEVFFIKMGAVGIVHRLAQAFFYSLLFLVTPVFLLAQTVPLISNYFSRRKLSEITGKMLFFSTTGSFLGSVFSTIVLMTTIGVHNTVIVTLSLLCILCLFLSRKRNILHIMLCIFLFSVIFSLNNNYMMKAFNIVSNNAYNMIAVNHNRDGSVTMRINGSFSSKFTTDPDKRFPYLQYIEKMFLNPLLKPESQPRDILIIGAGGFTIGWEDHVNNYTFIDIDPALKDVSEQFFLPEKLSPNKKFVAASARAFVHNNTTRYDLIILDTYSNLMSIPMECTTREYLEDVKHLLKDNGIVLANIISSPNFSDTFTVRYDNTFSSVFPKHSRQIVEIFDGWSEDNGYKSIVYASYNTALSQDTTIYTDDKNTYSLDRK